MSINILVIEPRTITALPAQPTHHAELRGTAAGHVIASFFQLHHRRTAVAFLPALLLRRLDELLRRGVLRTIPRNMRLVITDRAHSCPAALAFPNLPAVFDGDVVGLDPLTAALADTIHLVLGLVLVELPVPRLLEVLVE